MLTSVLPTHESARVQRRSKSALASRAASAADPRMQRALWRAVPLLLLSRRINSLATSTAAISTMQKLKLLSQQEATELDEDLMTTPGFSIDQLMELAGLSVAAAVQKQYPPFSHPRVLCVCGPGNNGGDGLVAARHLAQFGYRPAVLYPKRPSRPLFVNLATQMEMMAIPLLDAMPEQLDQEYDLVLDAVFGFSFAGAVRPPFDTVLDAMRRSRLPLCSVDIPSGWHVELGPEGAAGEALMPETLISLTAPKLASAHFAGYHYLGGRFVPPPIFEKYGFEQPIFPGAEQVVLILTTYSLGTLTHYLPPATFLLAT